LQRVTPATASTKFESDILIHLFQVYIDAAQPTRTISSRQAKLITRKICAGFQAIGLQKGDCVCMLSFNDIYYSMAFLGIVAAGGVFAGTNPSHTVYELAHSWKTAEAKALIVEPELLPNALKAAEEIGLPRERIFVFDHRTPLDEEVTGPEEGNWGGLKSWRELMRYGERDWERWDDEERSKETTAARLFSSGTTGYVTGTVVGSAVFAFKVLTNVQDAEGCGNDAS
jgi:long-subunit acyl-CoA synthetase (AMP-forming)